MEPSFFQSNSEGALIDALHRYGRVRRCGAQRRAYTHYSYAIRCHRGEFVSPLSKCICPISTPGRNSGHTSVLAPVCRGQISGFGPVSYLLALQALAEEV